MKKSVFFILIWLLPILMGTAPLQAQWLRTAGDVFSTTPSSPIARYIGKNDLGPMPIDTVINNASATKGTISYQNGRMLYNPLNGASGLDTIHFQLSIAGSPFEKEQCVAIIGNYNFLVCQDDIASLIQNDTVLIDVHANDFSKFAYNTFVSQPPLHGVCQILNNQIQYIPSANFIGRDSFQYYTAQNSAPFDSAWAWVRISVCPNATPIITSSVPQFGGMQLNVINSSALQLPLYYGIINDTNNKAYGYSEQHGVNSYAQSMFWNTPQMNGTHIGCVYVSDSRGCSSRTCLTSYITNCNPPPSAAFTSIYDTINNQLFINAATQNNSTLHHWELNFQSPYLVNPIYSGSNAIDSIQNILLPGNYTLTHISADISMQCADTSIYNFQIQLTQADTFSGYAFTDLNVDGLFQNGEPAAPAGTIVWVANASQPLFYLSPDNTGYFSIILKSDSLIWGTTATNLNTIQTCPIRPLVYHTPKGKGQWNVKGLLFGLHPAAYHVHGKLYVDLNGNNSIDNGEPILKNHSITIKNKLLISDSAGIYHYFTSSTNSLSIIPTPIQNFNASTQLIQPFAGISDYPVDISYIPLNASFSNGAVLITADEDSVYNSSRTFVHLQNYGTQALTGTVRLSYPDSVKIRFASDSAIIDSVHQVVSWKIKNPIACAQQATMHICWNANNPNQILNFEACLVLDSLQSDIDTLNNHDTLEVQVINPRPNSKWASPVGKGPAHSIAPWQSIRYVICARNPLNEPVINITILDTLDKDLNYRSWKFLNSSFPPSSVSYENGIATITYNDIFQLPGTNGSIESTFKVNPWPGLPMHKQIHNTATIYWDNLQHTHTNTVSHTIEYFLGITNTEKHYQITIYPNPASVLDQIHISSETSISSIKLFAMNGAYIGEEKLVNGSFTLAKSRLKPGSYLVQLCDTEKVLATKTLILE